MQRPPGGICHVIFLEWMWEEGGARTCISDSLTVSGRLYTRTALSTVERAKMRSSYASAFPVASNPCVMLGTVH